MALEHLMDPTAQVMIAAIVFVLVSPIIVAFAYGLETRPNRKRRTRKARR